MAGKCSSPAWKPPVGVFSGPPAFHPQAARHPALQSRGELVGQGGEQHLHKQSVVKSCRNVSVNLNLLNPRSSRKRLDKTLKSPFHFICAEAAAPCLERTVEAPGCGCSSGWCPHPPRCPGPGNIHPVGHGHDHGHRQRLAAAGPALSSAGLFLLTVLKEGREKAATVLPYQRRKRGRGCWRPGEKVLLGWGGGLEQPNCFPQKKRQLAGKQMSKSGLIILSKRKKKAAREGRVVKGRRETEFYPHLRVLEELSGALKKGAAGLKLAFFLSTNLIELPSESYDAPTQPVCTSLRKILWSQVKNTLSPPTALLTPSPKTKKEPGSTLPALSKGVCTEP